MILVTGGTGLVGTNLVRLLAKREERFRVLIRPTSDRSGLAGLNAEEALGDVTDYSSVRAAMKGVRKVYHVAGMVAFAQSRRSLIRTVNVQGTDNICRAALEEGVERLVHTSTVSAIAEATKDNPATEDSPYNLARYRIPYNDTKREAEDVVRKYIKKGLDAVIVNPGFMVGAWDIKPSSGKAILSIARFGMPFYSSGGTIYLDVEDAALGHILAMEKGRTGERYILGTENLSLREFFTMVAEVVGRRPPFIPVLYPVAMSFALLGNVLGRIWPKELEDLNTGLIKSGYLETYVSQAKAVRELGLPQNPVRAALVRAWNWFKENGYA